MDTIDPIIQKATSTLYTAGCDEAGAGCGASDLLVAAVILDPAHPIPGLADSKALSEKKREALFPLILLHALDYAIIHVSPQEIDQINIFQARMIGFTRALAALKRVDYAVIDGNKIPPNLSVEADFLVKGDTKLPAISAASILAKVTRDRLMLQQAEQYPQYGFEKHKGYLTKEHLEALALHGPSPIHRLSYKPVKDAVR